MAGSVDNFFVVQRAGRYSECDLCGAVDRVMIVGMRKHSLWMCKKCYEDARKTMNEVEFVDD